MDLWKVLSNTLEQLKLQQNPSNIYELLWETTRTENGSFEQLDQVIGPGKND